ncbi:MAG: response regulator transcription factor [Actinobacteria bacterium]|nr:response regulator transcription factor [Actinomycetota bacterium]
MTVAESIPGFRTKVLIVEDEEFTRTILADSLAGSGMTVRSAISVAEALDILLEFEPNAVVTDLHLGPGPDGVDLLERLNRDLPWIGQVVLTSHTSVQVALGINRRIPERAVYLVKSRITSLADVEEAIFDSITRTSAADSASPEPAEGRFELSASQGEILRLMSEGLSNAAIAARRETTLRSTESLVARTFATLGLSNDPNVNARVLAVRMWLQGQVVVRERG